MIQLSKRLQAVADLGQFSGSMADIGTDHGYIPIYLVQSGKVSNAIAMDIGKGPLLRAKEHIEKYHLSAYIQTRLSDGAKALQEKEVSSAVIAGMGGGLVQKILKDSEQLFHSIEEIILQPQSEIEQTRRFLCKEGYVILAENMVLEDGKYYPMMRVSYKEKTVETPYEKADDIDFLYGAYLLNEKHLVLRDYLKREAVIYKELLDKMHRLPQNAGVQKRTVEMNKQLETVKCALKKVGEIDEV